tara:strand:+ start:4530 stop:4991 length:462 start_codon:yes stop_codon:yes gene_type:complete
MITELLGLAGSGIFGSALGMIRTIMDSRGEIARRKLDLQLLQEARLHGTTIDYITSKLSGADYGHGFHVLCYTYCLCTLICFIWPDIPIQTFNPEENPQMVEIFWGLIKYSRASTHVYTITTGGVGYGLLHPIAFQIGSVLLGPQAGRGRGNA